MTPVHVATMLAVTDLGLSTAFYRDLLGFTVREEQEGIVLLALGPMLLYLVLPSPPTPDKPGVTLARTNGPDQTGVNLVFRVPDCQAAYHELSQRGLAFLTPPQAPSWGGWRCFARDPDGYLLEIEQPE